MNVWNRLPVSKILLVIATQLIFSANSAAQVDTLGKSYRAMFYNVENLFDSFDDSLTNDDEFAPKGTRHWTWEKMNKKLDGIYKTIVAVGGWEPPIFVGLCEIENGYMLYRLTHETPLVKYDYGIIHRESPDPRGIDVGLLFRKDLFDLKETKFFRVNFPGEPNRRTREILYACGIVDGMDTLHIFINHWPSKFGGELESTSGRFAAASTLKQKVDSIKVFYPDARILIMGDFNDEPESAPLIDGLKVCLNDKELCSSGLVSVSAILKANGQGSYKYQGVWGMIDQIIVSESMLSLKHKLYSSPNSASVFRAKFLLEPDDTFVGDKPFRTFAGFKYHGGFSDHLPVYIDLKQNK
ncbi:MAG TPA: endonuclease [Bacteroidales bacterium]|nr:endonuclease [Bacteroidales bacterium]